MSDRNTALFLPGHVDPAVVGRAFASLRGMDPAVFTGEEAPRVGHGTWEGRPYTHVALRYFEVAGLLILDQDELPAANEVELHLGRVLSEAAGRAVYLFYEEEKAAAGAATFEAGRLTDRECWDARELQPVRRTLDAVEELHDLDVSDYIWKPGAEVVERHARPLFGPGIRTDDEIEALIEAAGATPIALPRAAAPEPEPEGSDRDRPGPRKRDRLKGLLGRLRKG